MAQTFLLSGDWLMKGYIGEDWLWRNAVAVSTRDTRRWIPVVVPGSVQADLFKAGLIPDPYFEENSLLCEWVPERTWIYKRTFPTPPEMNGKRVRLVFDGIDYTSRVFLNGEQLGSTDGTFLPAEFDVSNKLKDDEDNLLAVVLDPAPFEQPQIGYTSRVRTQKPRMNFWWDFCPRLIHLGIWQDVRLEATGPVRVANLWVKTKLSVDLLRAEVEANIQLDTASDQPVLVEFVLRRDGVEDQQWQQQLRLPAGERGVAVSFRVDQPDLWQPNGTVSAAPSSRLGEQPALYTVEARVMLADAVSDERKTRFGIRRVEWAANEGAGEQALPYTLVVNGRKTYINGWNWVPADVLYGTVTHEMRRRLLRLAKAANCNLLRVWGGGLIETEDFYNLCDELGIMVWQEFIQSSSGIDNKPPEDADYIALLEQTAEAAVQARRSHPSLVVWCGGNELHDDPEHLCDDSHPALAALKAVVERFDPGRRWVATSPAGGVFSYPGPDQPDDIDRYQDVHGPWEFQGLREQFSLYNHGQSMLHSEFGVEALTNWRALDAVISRERQWPVTLDNTVWHHLGAWWVKETVWTKAFGPMENVDQVLRATQFLQAEGLRYGLESDRRRQFRNSGTMPWQFNEPYPMAACTSAVDYFGEPKPVYYAAARAYAPLTVTARFDTLAWGGEAEFSADIWVSNAGEAPIHEVELTAHVIGLDGKEAAAARETVSLPANRSQQAARIAVPMQRIGTGIFFLDLALNGLDGVRLAGGRYVFSGSENMAPLLAAPQADVKASVQRGDDHWLVTLENTSEQAALLIWFEMGSDDPRGRVQAWFSDNYFSLLPGERRVVRVDWSGTEIADRKIHIAGWNTVDMLLE